MLLHVVPPPISIDLVIGGAMLKLNRLKMKGLLNLSALAAFE